MKVLAKGTKIKSYMGMKSTMAKPMKHCSEAAGMLKPGQIVLSIVAPCLVKKVVVCANTMPYPKLDAQIGTSLRAAFASITSLIVQTSPFEPSVGGKALLRNLEHR